VKAIDVGEQPSLLQKNPQASTQRMQKSGITNRMETLDVGGMADEVCHKAKAIAKFYFKQTKREGLIFQARWWDPRTSRITSSAEVFEPADRRHHFD